MKVYIKCKIFSDISFELIFFNQKFLKKISFNKKNLKFCLIINLVVSNDFLSRNIRSNNSLLTFYKNLLKLLKNQLNKT